MTDLKTLIPGYVQHIDDTYIASCSTVLIRDSEKNIMVDPGINKSLLLNKLQKENLTPDDIDIVFLTHFHLDHSFLAAIFPNATTLDGETIYEADKESDYENTIPGTSIRVLPTPGHAYEHSSLLIKAETGTIVIAADLFWWMDDEEQRVDDYDLLVSRDDPFMVDKEELVNSRKQVLAIADWIIPGHGQMFKNIHKA